MVDVCCLSVKGNRQVARHTGEFSSMVISVSSGPFMCEQTLDPFTIPV